MTLSLRRWSAALILLLLLGGCSAPAADSNVGGLSATDNYTGLFAGDAILSVEIALSDEDLADMIENAIDEVYHSATVTIDGITLENVGVRTKGNSSLRSVANSDSNRYSLRIKFDKYVEGQTFLGLDELVVNNMFSDASYMREYLSYEAMSALGLDTPLTAYTTLTLNGEPYGFYLAVEALDDSFIARALDGGTGNLYKAEEGSTLLSGSAQYLEHKIGSDTEGTALAAFIEALNAMPDGEKGDIESVLDVDSALKMIAANTALGNYDSYSGTFAHNYYLYERDGLFTLIPWDLNMSFGGFAGGGGGMRGGQEERQLPADANLTITSVVAEGDNSALPPDRPESGDMQPPDGFGGTAPQGEPGGERPEGMTPPEGGAPGDRNFGDMPTQGGSDATTVSIDEPVSGTTLAARPLIEKLLSVEEYRERYYGYLEELCGYLEGVEGRINELAGLIRPYVEDDPTKFVTMAQFEAAIADRDADADSTGDTSGGVTDVVGVGIASANEPSLRTSDGTQPGVPPDGGPFTHTENTGGMGGGRGRSPGGGMMTGGSEGSILTFAKARLLNLSEQLA